MDKSTVITPNVSVTPHLPNDFVHPLDALCLRYAATNTQLRLLRGRRVMLPTLVGITLLEAAAKGSIGLSYTSYFVYYYYYHTVLPL